MKKLLCISILTVASVRIAFAGSSDHQTLQFDVAQVADITLGVSPSFRISDIPPGGTGSDTKSTTYGISINDPNPGSIITVNLSDKMPDGTHLYATVTPPAGAGAAIGAVDLNQTSQTVVQGIIPVNQTGIAVSYQFTATYAAAPGTFSRDVFFTLVAK